MKFLLDVCADSRKMRTALTSQGHDVLYPCVIRSVGMSVADRVNAVLDLIENNVQAIESGFLITVTQNRVRIRP